MAEHQTARTFLGAPRESLSLPDALSKARLSIAAITSAPVDAVRSCNRTESGQWIATVEVVESPARMGNNDLLSAYELTMDNVGELVGVTRVGRYHREDGAGP